MEKNMTHDEMHEQGIAHEHTHEQGHSHTHKETKAVLNRMSKIIGHMEAVKSMVENGRDCSEVLIQLAAVKSAISSVSRVILKDHIDHCIVDAVRENDTESIEELKKAIDKFL
ncbi:MAG: metal-sensing transcriptional repressor [Lachnospiraceae bacterium]